MTEPNIIQVLKSVFAAFVGIQTDANRQKDFSQNSAKLYIIVGIIFTAIFVTGLILLVSIVLG